jgi:hypothetical protein
MADPVVRLANRNGADVRGTKPAGVNFIAELRFSWLTTFLMSFSAMLFATEE